MALGQAQPFEVRGEYPHLLISACQRFLASVLLLEPDAFVGGVNKLTAETPRPESTAEAVMAWFILQDAVVRGAENRHAWFHQRIHEVGCPFRPRFVTAPLTSAPTRIASVLRDFASDYTRGFDAVHAWPPAIRAAAVLRANPHRPCHCGDVAKAVYVSAATLTRSFGKVFGVTLLQYHARVRLRSVVEQIRATGTSIEGILVEHGFRSPKDAYRLFRRLTGTTLSSVRRLSDVEYAALIDGTLALPTAEWRTVHPREALPKRV
jgi:AraC-like DNA-binding protein